MGTNRDPILSTQPCDIASLNVALLPFGSYRRTAIVTTTQISGFEHEFDEDCGATKDCVDEFFELWPAVEARKPVAGSRTKQGEVELARGKKAGALPSRAPALWCVPSREAAWKKLKVQCECGTEVLKANFARHKKSQKHQSWEKL